MSILHRRVATTDDPFGIKEQAQDAARVAARQKAGQKEARMEKAKEIGGNVLGGIAAAGVVWAIGLAAFPDEPMDNTGEEFAEGYVHNLEPISESERVARGALEYQDCMATIKESERGTRDAVNYCLDRATAPKIRTNTIGDETANTTAAHQIEE